MGILGALLECNLPQRETEKTKGMGKEKKNEGASCLPNIRVRAVDSQIFYERSVRLGGWGEMNRSSL